MRIGIDIMGGDYSPGAAIEGSLLAQKNLPTDTEVVFIGNKQVIKDYCNENGIDISTFEIIHTSHVVGMGDHPLKAYKKHPDASIFLGQKLLKNMDLDGFCSAGNTGAMLVGAMHITTPIPGVIRPGISSTVPNLSGNDSIIIDVGLNPDARPDVLYQYGMLGSILSSYVFHIEQPRVSLLNIGAESEKGNLVVRSAYELMVRNDDFYFIGNLEPNSLFTVDNADVLVCDGFVGNIVLKEAESFYKLISMKNVCPDSFEMFNFENFGGTPVLGVRAPLVIGHGISNAKAIKNMINTTFQMVEAELSEIITEKIKL